MAKYEPPDRNCPMTKGCLVSYSTNIPLVVDLDGTLTPTDTLVESVVQVIKKSPLNFLVLPFWLLKGRAAFKHAVASRANISAEYLPYRLELLDYLKSEKEKGREIILATAAHYSIAANVNRHLGLFDQVLATDGNVNLKGVRKLEAIRNCVGDKFSYVGDSQDDLPIWKSATAAVLVDVPEKTAAVVRGEVPVEREFARSPIRLSVWLQAFRVHQWLKNLLLFVPWITAFAFLDANKLAMLCMAFFAFSFAASATYVVNDLWDLDSDRQHIRKRNRPFASARLPISYGVGAAAFALITSIFIASMVGEGFLIILFVYLVLTSSYSWIFKEYVLIDVLMLSLLYTLRIFAGSVATHIMTSSWLLAFSIFIFLSLALVKRCAELILINRDGKLASNGRDYRVSDLTVLWPLGVGGALSSVVVFGLFISSHETQERYGSPDLLWLVAFGLIYWLARLWIKTSRGEMDDDPVVYAIKDRGSRIVIFCLFSVMIFAHSINIRLAP